MNSKDIEKALLGSKSEYEKTRKTIIAEKGYDGFREEQKKAFKRMFS